MPTARSPGMSSSSHPCGSRSSVRDVVVCWHTVSPIACVCSRSSAFTMVDLPTPLEPNSAAVCPGFTNEPSSGARSSSVPLSSTVGANADATACLAADSAHKSRLFKTITGCTPASIASAKYRSKRAGFQSPSNPRTKNATSMLAAKACRCPPSCTRVKSDCRSTTCTINAGSVGVTATQSPATGSSNGESTAYSSRPANSPRTLPESVSNSYTPRLPSTTRAGANPASLCDDRHCQTPLSFVEHCVASGR